MKVWRSRLKFDCDRRDYRKVEAKLLVAIYVALAKDGFKFENGRWTKESR